METVKDFLECELFNTYDYVEVCNYDDDEVIIQRMTIKQLWQHFHDTENYTADEFELMSIYCGNSFYCDKGYHRGYITLLVRYESC